ncbi:MAG: ComEA family DNA-binding protein [Candidatus Levybacteria bacterium]|nr:ComEA family DNA-binding protein [Candidatus Levybacteria bacterium]
MDSQLSEKWKDVLRKHWLPLSLALLGLIFFVYGLIAFLGQSKSSGDIKIQTNSNTQTASENLLTVDIEGEVTNPGVYRLKQGSIVQDGLALAGGLSASADRDWVSKNLNLALKLTDSQKIYIPRIGESISSSVLGSTVSDTVPAVININSALESELDTLPGIGPVTAEKIINNRPYSQTDDLLTKKVVSQKVFDQIKDKISAY